MKRTIAFIICQALCMTAIMAANTDSLKVVADSAYAQEDFSHAAKVYGHLAKQGESAIVCYNLGNCYYRMDDIAHAILWYERASLLSPGDEDIRFNLNMARSKTIDRVVPKHEFFFVAWYRSLVNWKSADEWGHISILMFLLCLISVAVYIYGSQIWLRKTAFTMALIFFLLTMFGNVCAWSQRSRLTARDGAVVMVPSAVVKSTPAQSGSDLFVLHEGTYVTIRDNSLSEWVEVVLADGKQGWMEKRQIEVI